MSNTYTDWQAVISEPPIPQIRAGESYQSFGNTVWRVTDETMPPDRHYYSDRSPLNANSTCLVLIDGGGGTWMMGISPVSGAPTGTRWQPRYPYASIAAEGHWHPTDPEKYFCIVGGTALAEYRPAPVAEGWTIVKSFVADLDKAPAGRLKIMHCDGDNFVLDYESVSKHNEATIFYQRSTGKTSVYIGTEMTGWTPKPNASFFVNGTNSPLPKSGKWYMTQASGTAVNASSPVVRERQNTATYRVPMGADPLASGEAIAGEFNVNHGTTLTHHHVRCAGGEEPWYDGFNSQGNPDWIMLFRAVDVRGTADPMDFGRIKPYKDLFMLPSSLGMSGIHLSCNGKRDDWVIAGLYQESPAPRITGPLANEIIAIDTSGEAEYNGKIAKQGKIRRLAHHFSAPGDAPNHSYWTTPRPSLSLDQRFVVFTTSFGVSGRSSVCILRLPDDMAPKQPDQPKPDRPPVVTDHLPERTLMYNQLATVEEAKEIAKELGGIGGGVTDMYVPEYGGPFVPPENGPAKFLHFKFANGADGFNVGLIRAFMQYSPLRWPLMLALEVDAAAKDKTVKTKLPDVAVPDNPADPPPPPATKLLGPDLSYEIRQGRYNSLPGDTSPVGSEITIGGVKYTKKGVPMLGGALSMFWEADL